MFIFLLNKGIYKKFACVFSLRLSGRKSTLWLRRQDVNKRTNIHFYRPLLRNWISYNVQFVR